MVKKISFKYQGINQSGKIIKGEIETFNKVLAKVYLKKQGLNVKKIYQKRSVFSFLNNKTIKKQDICLFSRQLSTLIDSGVPIVQTFDIIAKNQNNIRFQSLIFQIKNGIESGLTLSEAFQKHPKYFDKLYCNLINAGEKSGCLDLILNKIATYQEKIECLKKKIKHALTYPCIISVIALLITTGLLRFVVPQFESLFTMFGAELPGITKFILILSAWIKTYASILTILLILVFVSWYYFKNQYTHLMRYQDKILLNVPIIGILVNKTAIANFSRTFAITFAAGLPLVETLKLVASISNSVFEEATNTIKDDISTGLPLHVALSNSQLFPNIVIQLVTIGEETGTLEKMFNKIADIYEEDVDNAINSLSSLLEPIIMTLLGFLIGGLVIAMYLPMFQLGSII